MAPGMAADAIGVEEAGKQVLNLIREVLSLSDENSVHPPLFSGEEVGGLRLYMMLGWWKRSLRPDGLNGWRVDR